MAKTPSKTKKEPNSSEPKRSLTEIKGPRRLSTPKYQSFKLQKPIKAPTPKLPNSVRIFVDAIKLPVRHWRLFGGILTIYAIINVLLVQSFKTGNEITQVKSIFDEASTGKFAEFISGTTLFAYLLGSSGNTSSPTAGAYQFFLTLFVSLAIIWALRQVYANHKVRIRDAFYSGMYPLVPFICVLVVIGVQLVPIFIGQYLYSLVINNGIAVGPAEQFIWGVVFFLMILWSLYMITSSIFALYIVALPDMTPMRALRSARELVQYRRWTVLRKLIFLPILLLLAAAIIMIPLIMFATPVAGWAFFILTTAGLIIIHSYVYRLYRELLQ